MLNLHKGQWLVKVNFSGEVLIKDGFFVILGLQWRQEGRRKRRETAPSGQRIADEMRNVGTAEDTRGDVIILFGGMV